MTMTLFKKVWGSHINESFSAIHKVSRRGLLASSLLMLAAPVLHGQNVPVADAQSVTLDEDKGKVIVLSGSDVDAGTLLSYMIVTPPSHGSLSGIGPTRVYSPEANYNGSDNFTFKVHDGGLESAVVTVSLTINPVDEPTVPGPAILKFVDPNPSAGNGFGTHVVALNTGNVVITAPNATIDGKHSCGAVYLFNGSTGALISTLTGFKIGDSVGAGGVFALTNGNFVVRSLYWDNGTAQDAGAVTWCSGSTGLSGAVSSANSLVGTTAYDFVGSDPQLGVSGVVTLTNGNFVVISKFWDTGMTEDVGAVTWGNGSTGSTGVIGAANSLVGSTTRDYIGFGGVIVLSNGNYVVNSYEWKNAGLDRVGAVTWGSGSTGVVGVVSAVNSLVGTAANDGVGSGRVVALANGNYVVGSYVWANGSVVAVGAVTWANGSTGISGPVSAANSLVGSRANEQVGREGVTPLTNGNYVVNSVVWGNGVTPFVGAVTWGNGTTGITGPVSASNSLVGSALGDFVGFGGVVALSNGNYVVSSFGWTNGSAESAGAVTWGNGATGITGPVTTANSLVGSSSVDQIGRGSITALTNGNYVVCSPYWRNGGATEAGAVTWGNGAAGTTGVVSPANSLVGSASFDSVGSGGSVALPKGNFVALSPAWDNVGLANTGAVTWGSGSTGISGPVSAANSLVGTSSEEKLGRSGVTALINGNYVVLNPAWDNGTTLDVGAVTWGSGSLGISGTASAANSLIGTTAEDQVGLHGVTALTNGNYVVRSQLWDRGTEVNAGAVTWGDGSTGISGAVSVVNSHVGGVSAGNPNPPAMEPLNNTFITGWQTEGKARLGSQENGFGPAPEISVRGNGVAILNSKSVPSTMDGTDFASVLVLNTQLTRNFTIHNTGNVNLNLTGTPRVTLSGPDAGDFAVTQQPDSPVMGSSKSFSITFDPTLPGQRDATVNIASNDTTAATYTFAISGFGALPAPQTQTITFTPPPTLYLGQSPFALTATASSGLPVTLTILSGPASIAGSDVIFNGTGIVTVRASQPGGNNFAAAPSVTRTISVRTDPTALTLLDLAQTYDGSPKEISTIGAVNPTITYSIGGVFGPSAPTSAGSYPVKAVAGSITKTGTLVIAKAVLTVAPDYKQKFAGQPNPQLSAVITGYQGTDSASVLTKPVVLTTTAKSTSPGGLYPITASGAAALNYNFRYLAGTMVIESFAGSYEVLLVDGTPLPVAKLNIIVTSSGTAFTAKLATATEPLVVSFSGPLSTDPLTEIATGTATTNVTVNKVLVPYTILFNFEFSGAVTASATRQSVALGPITVGRKLWVPAKGQLAAYAGAHTAVFEPAIPAATAVPVGAGWATATINTLGTMTLAGRLADGTTFTTTLSPDGEENPGYRFFAQPYIAARTQSYIAGEFSLIQHPNPESNPSLNNRRYVEQTVLTWKKTSLTTDAAHRTSFGPVSTVMMLDPWLLPTVAKGAIPAVTLAQRLGLEATGTSFAVTHSETGSASQSSLPTNLGLSATNIVSVLAPVTSPVNRTKWRTLTFKTTDGTFTGSFELSDLVGAKTVLRPVTFSGVLRQPATSADTLIGNGHYLAPLPTSTERISGEIMFTRP
jgi:Repeat of unknown function (DUF5650)/MBG domain (YGX type)/Bacterial Ig domain